MLALISVPETVGKSMIAEGKAEAAQSTRGEVAVAQLIFEVVGATANLVTILIAADQIGEMVQRIRGKDSEAHTTPGKTVTVRSDAKGPVIMEFTSADDSGVPEEFVNQVVEALQHQRRVRKTKS